MSAKIQTVLIPQMVSTHHMSSIHQTNHGKTTNSNKYRCFNYDMKNSMARYDHTYSMIVDEYDYNSLEGSESLAERPVTLKFINRTKEAQTQTDGQIINVKAIPTSFVGSKPVLPVNWSQFQNGAETVMTASKKKLPGGVLVKCTKNGRIILQGRKSIGERCQKSCQTEVNSVTSQKLKGIAIQINSVQRISDFGVSPDVVKADAWKLVRELLERHDAQVITTESLDIRCINNSQKPKVDTATDFESQQNIKQTIKIEPGGDGFTLQPTSCSNSKIEKSCKMCATKRADVVLLSKYFQSKFELYLSLRKFTGKSMDMNDLSLNVCNECIGKLEESFKFVERIRNTCNELKTLITNSNKSDSRLDGSCVKLNNSTRNIDTSIQATREIKLCSELERMKCESDSFRDSFQCNFCFAMFESERLVRVHEESHDKTIAYLLTPFKSEEELKLHSSEHSSKSSPTLCERCGHLCVSQVDYWRHCLIDHPKAGPMECTFCSDIYPSESKLLFHVRDSHSGELSLGGLEKTRCRHCGIFVSTECIASHIKSHEESLRFTCDECQISFDGESQVEKHIALHTRVCVRCDKKFVNDAILLAHLEKHEVESQPRQRHEKCFNSNESLQNHSPNRPGEDRNERQLMFACKLCKETFTESILLWEHRKAHTRAERNNYFRRLTRCEQCEQCFYTKESYCLHIMSKHKFNINELKCILCGVITENEEEFLTHVDRHRETVHCTNRIQTKIKCDFCEVYVSKEALRDHVGSAHPENSENTYYVCHLCGQRIECFDHFRLHMKAHDDEDPFKFNYYQTNFGGFSAKEEHARTSHPEYLESPIHFRSASKRKATPNESPGKRWRVSSNYREASSAQLSSTSSTGTATRAMERNWTNDLAHFFKATNGKAKREYGYACSVCSVIFVSCEAREMHVNRDHPDSDEARECTEAAIKGRTLRRVYLYRCSICNAKLTSQFQLVAHVNAKHPDGVKIVEYKCSDHYVRNWKRSIRNGMNTKDAS